MALAWQTILGAVSRAPAPLLSSFASVSTRFWVEQAIDSASRRLGTSECQRVLSDFRDGSGTPLEIKLTAIGVTPAEYLAHWIWFVDGSDQTQCVKYHTNAFTQPRSRVVFICGQRIVNAVSSTASSERDVVIIHEMLHTLGLGENPPSSAEITKQVMARCGR